MANEKKGIVQEFVEFISRGNVVDLAVGVIIGGAFTSVVNSLVSTIIQPLISAIGGSPEVKGLSLVLNGQTIASAPSSPPSSASSSPLSPCSSSSRA